MIKLHLPKRTLIQKPKVTAEEQPANSEVKTYFLSEEELEKYRSLPKPEDPRKIYYPK